MRNYELSISSDYVPTWGVVEAVREFFQNALDGETADSGNKMFFDYDESKEVLRIGNKHGKLDHRTLLFGYTDKNENANMIGNHGEGYKIATVVLLRLNKQIVFYNYGCREVWRPRFVNSRRYGVKVPTFFVDDKHFWEKVPDDDLVIEITGITKEEYDQIVESNLHLQGYKGDVETRYGYILSDKYKGKIFVGGLYICSDPRLDIGLNFNPDVVSLERDRSMVNSFDVQWYASRMIEQTGDIDRIEHSLSGYSGQYISIDYLSSDIADEIARKFLEENGYDAIPVSDESDKRFLSSRNTVIVSRSKRDIINRSSFFASHSTASSDEVSTLYSKFCEFGKKYSRLWSDSAVDEYVKLIKQVRDLEDKLDD